MSTNILDRDGIVRAVREWLKGAGVSVEREMDLCRMAGPEHPFELLVLSLTGPEGSPVQKLADDTDGRLLVRWLLPIREEGGACSVADLARRKGDGDRLWTFPALFRMRAFDDAHRQKRDKTPSKARVHPLNLPPDLEAEGSEVIPAWWRDVRLAWMRFADTLKRLEARGAALTPYDFAKLEARLNAPFVSSRARSRLRCFEDGGGAEANPLRKLEARRNVLIDWPARTLGRLRVPHESHGGRLCPFQTPESQKIGLSLHLAAGAEIYPLDGKIKPGKSLLSAAVGLVPYPLHTDGPRLMMGGKNMKQAEIGIKGAEPPIVPGYYEGTGMTRERRKIFEGCLDGADRFAPPLGLNALTVIMPYKGYTYEDGLVISESLAERLFIEEGSYSYAKVLKDVVFKKDDLDAKGLSGQASLEAFFKGRREFLKGRRFVYGDSLLPNEDGLGLTLYANKGTGGGKKEDIQLEPLEIKDIYAHHAPGVLRRIDVDCPIVKRDRAKNAHVDLTVTWTFAVQRPMGMGDKLTGRNGNKGVVTKVLPDKDMPQIHFKEGGEDKVLPAELVISPSSIMGRKNLGQIWEMAHSLMIRLGGEPLAQELEDKLDLMNAPIDGALSWEDIRPILEGFGADGRGAFKITGEDIPKGARAFAGWQYFCRLHHHAWKKLQARGADGPMDWASGQPMACGARTGQRMGEMENWSLLSHGALDALSSMRESQNGDFAKTRRLFSAILLSLGVQTIAGEGGGLEFVPRLGDEAPGDTLQRIANMHYDEPYPAYRALSYKRDTQPLRDDLLEKIEECRKKPPEQNDGDERKASDKERRLIERVERIMNSPGFFDKDGALHVETLLLDSNPDLKSALKELFWGGSAYSQLNGLLRYHDGLVEMLSGKAGVPRRFLLGRRYSHSGRAVIVPEPSLAPHEAYLPVAMLVELLDGYDREYLRRLDRGLRNTEKLRAIVNDIPKMKDKAGEIARKMDGRLMEDPLWVFLVRQPSLHRHSVQAFRARCWEHPVIGMPPLATPGFNADFDGDTMAVFLPPYGEAADLSRFSLIENPGLVGTGKPAFADGLDLALGWRASKGKAHKEKLGDYIKKVLHGMGNSEGESLKTLQGIGPYSFNERSERLKALQEKICFDSTGAATLAPGDFEALCGALEGVPKPKVLKTEGKEETERAKAKLEDVLKHNPSNGLALMLDSGAKGKLEDVLQMVWALGKIEKMRDDIPEEKQKDTEEEKDREDIFIAGNYWRGLTEDELFVYSYPSRYSMAQKKLSVAEAGYLSRQLAEGLYELAVSGEDCGTTEGLRVECKDGRLAIQGERLPTLGDLGKDLERAAWGRTPLGLGFCLDSECLGFILDYWLKGYDGAKTPKQEAVLEHLKSNGGALVLRSPLFCKVGEAGRVCPLCCGADLARKPYGRPEPVGEGYAAGLTAAQAIGERGTQLAMKRFHDVSNVSASPIQAMRLLLIHGKAEERTPRGLLRELFDKVLRVPPPKEGKGKDGQEELEANGELPQALIHYELALTPLLYREGGLDAEAAVKEGRFLSALAHESAGKAVRFGEEKPARFGDALSAVKSRLMWEGGKN